MKYLKDKQEFTQTHPSKDILDVFDTPKNIEEVEFLCEEFTSLCPITGQPDYAKIIIKYSPLEKCIESKSLKLYLFTYRNYKGFAEKICSDILRDICFRIFPKEIMVQGHFASRGGISIKSTAMDFPMDFPLENP